VTPIGCVSWAVWQCAPRSPSPMEEMVCGYTGIFKIGDKAAGSVTHVQVVEEPTSSCGPMAVADYVGRGCLPRHDDLSWR
jgi:hypothetical protein